MKFKHTFHVFVDNFSITYKQLLYRFIIILVAAAIGITCLYPFVKEFINSDALNLLTANIKNYFSSFLDGEVSSIANTSLAIRDAYDKLIELFKTRITEIVLMGLLILLLYVVQKWFAGLGNYATAVLINDKMALRAKSPFVGTMISHLKEASIYNLIYVPLTILYDIVVYGVLFVILFFMLNGIRFFLINMFLFSLMTVMAAALKMTFTCDWLPALIRGKTNNRQAIKLSFSRKGKDSLNIYSNFIVLVLLIIGVNAAAAIFTLGVGALITIPASYVILICFEFVNYYDREDIRYFIDKNTIVKPDKERVLTREEFFTGTGGENP